MRIVSIVLVYALAACGDDDGVAGDDAGGDDDGAGGDDDGGDDALDAGSDGSSGDADARPRSDAACGQPTSWLDPVSGLCWQDPPSAEYVGWSEARAYCAGLSLGGAGEGEWRLPDIGELQSLVAGCPEAMDHRCDELEGPGMMGCYLPPDVSGPCGWYWSASEGSSVAGRLYAWVVFFDDPDSVEVLTDIPSTIYARCVRR
jgi:hypothetical protein